MDLGYAKRDKADERTTEINDMWARDRETKP
jgi:hypothetical protein